MENYCAFSQNHKCLKWTDYKLTITELEEADSLCHENWIEIQRLYKKIDILEALLKEAGIEIKEMNSGCICCSLVGDFGTSLKEVLNTYHPERIVIEPSGVGKLSDVAAAVKNVDFEEEVQLNSAVAVVDASKCKMYIKNFGEFFVNQIEHAGTIVLSRTGNISEEKLNKAIELIREHNAEATIITTPWDELDGQAILDTMEKVSDMEKEGLVVRERYENDKRSWRIYLTDKGKKRTKELKKAYEEMAALIQKDMSKEEEKILSELLLGVRNRLLESLEKMEIS